MTIKMRILIPMIAFTIIASSVVLISDILQFSSYVKDDIGNRLNMATLTGLSEIESLKSQAKAASLYLAKDSFIMSYLEDDDYTALFERAVQLNANTGMNFCIITDENGIVRVCTHREESHGLDANLLSSVKSALSGIPTTTIEPGLSIRLSVSSAAPIYDDNGNLLGAVMTGFPLGTNEFVDSIKSVTGCEVSVCQEDVRIATTITLKDGTRALGTKAPPEISRVVLTGGTYGGRVEIMSNELISNYHPLLGIGGNVVGMLFVGHYTNEATATIGDFIRMGLLFMILFTSIFVVIISYISGHIVMPINEAADVLSQISKGRFDARVKGDYKGDLALIKNSVNNTAKELSLYLNEKIKAEHIAHKSELEKTRAVESSIIKSEFLASMSHEIRTPMNAIIGMSELLSMEPLNDRQQEYVRDIRISSTSLLGIINDILDMTKIESGKLKLTLVHFEFLPFINSIVSIMTYSARTKGLDFILETDETLPKCLYGDDVRLRQILLNLLSNSIKFTEKGSVRLTVKYNDGTVHFGVSDTGIGIQKDDISRLFVSFEQLDAVKNRHKQGTGLGLPITKSLIEMMKGELSVNSVYGEGSTFTVNIPMPVGDETQAESTVNTVEALTAKDAAVLLVDDNDANRNVGCGLLKLNGIECDTASGGEMALQMVQEKDYDIVFMDHMMPGMDGVETTSKIRALKGKYEQLTIIALSANAVLEARELFLSSGMNDFLAKPIERALLIQMLKKWLPPEKVSIAEKTSNSDRTLEYDEVMSKLRQIDGIDVSAGLKLTSGSTELYKDTLKIITKHMPEAIAAAESLLKNGDIHLFAVDIHGIKSSMATAGAKTLSEKAFDMETAANTGNLSFCNAAFPEFSAQFLSLYKSLSEIFTEDSQAPLYAGNMEMLKTQLDEIRHCIDAFDDEAATGILASLRNYDFGEQINDLLKTLNRQIEIFEYENSVNIIDSLEKYL